MKKLSTCAAFAALLLASSLASANIDVQRMELKEPMDRVVLKFRVLNNMEPAKDQTYKLELFKATKAKDFLFQEVEAFESNAPDGFLVKRKGLKKIVMAFPAEDVGVYYYCIKTTPDVDAEKKNASSMSFRICGRLGVGMDPNSKITPVDMQKVFTEVDNKREAKLIKE